MALVTTVTRIEGIKEAIEQFRRAPKIARKYVGKAVQVTEIYTAQRVRHAAPVDTGALRHAITSETRGLRASISIEGGEFGGGQNPGVYWRFVEFGTWFMPARPFIRESAEAEEPQFIQRVKDAAKHMASDLDRF